MQRSFTPDNQILFAEWEDYSVLIFKKHKQGESRNAINIQKILREKTSVHAELLLYSFQLQVQKSTCRQLSRWQTTRKLLLKILNDFVSLKGLHLPQRANTSSPECHNIFVSSSMLNMPWLC